MPDPGPHPLKISYGRDIDQALDDMETRIRSDHLLTDRYLPRWVALKYLENDWGGLRGFSAGWGAGPSCCFPADCSNLL